MNGVGFGVFSTMNGVGFGGCYGVESGDKNLGLSSNGVDNSILQILEQSTAPSMQVCSSPTEGDIGMSMGEHSGKRKWDQVSLGDEYCPDAIAEYIMSPKKSSDLNLKVKRHLSYSGWKIETLRDQNGPRVRYISPNGKVYMSLTRVCCDLRSPPQEPASVKHVSPGASSSSFTSNSSMVRPSSTRPQEVVAVNGNGHCPQAVSDYVSLCTEGKASYITQKSEAKEKAKAHLLSSGWTFFRTRKKDKDELRYRDPNGKVFYSLLRACKWYVEENPITDDERSGGVADLTDTELQDVQIMQNEPTDTELQQVQIMQNEPTDIELQDVQIMQNEPADTQLQGIKMTPNGLPGMLNTQKIESNETGLHEVKLMQNGFLGMSEAQELVQQGPSKFRKILQSDCTEPEALITEEDVKDPNQTPGSMLRPCRTARNQRVLPLLIDNNLVQLQAKVQYRKKDGTALKDGIITLDGIQCCCCNEVFGLSKFEAHAGSTYHRPSEYIFLEDGRSLTDCQLELGHKSVTRKPKTESCSSQKNHIIKHDYICSVCHDGGKLLLCDKCPSTFHISCLGLKEVPQGNWFCPSCCCGICQQNENKSLVTDNRMISCYQCEHQYHVGCLRNKCLLEPESDLEGKWFCNYKCKQIFLGLNQLLEKVIAVGHDNLTWKLLKHTNEPGHKDDHSTENQTKLSEALGVMHECFKSVKEHLTKTDLWEDVIYSKECQLKRLDFRGFYTAILEKNEEVVTVATLRVHGEKVAEIPLVATLFKYRRLGMCRTLMNVLEKKLAELGVQRLVLPAIADAMNTWTGCFGFSVMTEAERLNFLDCTFLEFYGTSMCQKMLQNNLCTNSKESQIPEALQHEEFDLDDFFKQSPNDMFELFHDDCGGGLGSQLHLTGTV